MISKATLKFVRVAPRKLRQVIELVKGEPVAKALHILNNTNKTVISINLPVTYPPFKINGAMVSDCQLTPSKDCNFTYPVDLFAKVGWNKDDYILSVKRLGYYNDGQEIDFLQDITKSTERRAEFTLHLMENINWDLCTVVFTETDWLQHKLLHYIDRTHPYYNDKFKLLINDYFSKVDKIIYNLVEKASKDTSVFIISDHGFGPSKGKIYINSLLKSLGLLKVKKIWLKEIFIDFQDKLRSFLNQKSTLYRNSKNIIKSLSKFRKERGSPQDFSKTKHVLSRIKLFSLIDWSRTKAYFIGDTGATIFINSDRNNYAEIHNKITKALKEISNPETKTPLNFQVYQKKDIYHGPYFDVAPDLVLDSNSGYKFVLDANSKMLFHKTTKRIWNHHYREGILVMSGSNINGNMLIRSASIMDIAPTILYLLGIPVPDDMDGKVLTEGIKEDFLKHNPIMSQKSNTESKDESSEKVYSKEDMSKIKEHLADLGYID